MSKLNSLQQYLGPLQLPDSVVRKRTFLDISGFPYYETVISNWYRYFLDEKEDHGLGDGLAILPEIDEGIGEYRIKQANLTYKPSQQKGVWLH